MWHWDLLLAAHHVKLAEPFIFLGPAVVDAAIGLQHATIDAEVGQFAHVWVGRRLEDQRSQRCQLIRLDLFFARWSLRRRRSPVSRGWGIGDECIEQSPRALAFRGCRHEDWHGCTVEDRRAQALLNLLVGQILPLQVLHDEFIVCLGGGLDQRYVRFLCLSE